MTPSLIFCCVVGFLAQLGKNIYEITLQSVLIVHKTKFDAHFYDIVCRYAGMQVLLYIMHDAKNCTYFTRIIALL